MKLLLSLLLVGCLQTLSAQIKEDTITLKTTSGDLKGSLFIPDTKKKFPVVVILAGSGPTDRYGNSIAGVKGDTYKMMAQALAENKIGTFTYDKRGVAKSIRAYKSEAELRFEDYVNDAVEWINYIKKDKRIGDIYIAGHSEGSLLAMLVVQKVKLAGYISIAGPARGINTIISEQYGKQLPKAAKVVDSLFERMKNNQPLDTVPKYLASMFRPSIRPYMKSWMKYIPCDEIKKIKIPILIIQGVTDIQVEENEARLLKQCSPAAAMVIIDSMNHVLKNAPLDRTKNLATYMNPDLPLSDNLISSIAGFINKNSK